MSIVSKTARNVALAAAAVFTITSSAAMAGNAGASLGDCYNHVISACNTTAHPIPCSNSGMDACDEEHSSLIELPEIKSFRATTKKTMKFAAKKNTAMIQPAKRAR